MKFNPKRTRNLSTAVYAVCVFGALYFSAIKPWSEPALKTKVAEAETALDNIKVRRDKAALELKEAGKELESCFYSNDKKGKPMKCDWDVSLVAKAKDAEKAVVVKEKELKQAKDAYYANIRTNLIWTLSFAAAALLAHILVSMASLVHKLKLRQDANKSEGVLS